MLGKYVKPIELLGTPQENQLSDIAKVGGAKQVINVLGGLKQPPRILLSYKAIQGCPMITMFQDKPGTIWGFEDVRLPYVQAARETKWGQQPLRMLDMWEAITPALAGYSALIAKPAQTIEECVKKGVEQVRRGIREHAEQYQGMIEEQYIPAYEAQCTSFLTFLVSRLPYSKYLEQPKQTGKDPGKLLPSFACKAGIWWAQSPSQDRPLYYCIDGLNMRDAVNYKAFKTKAINGYLSALGTPAAKLLDLRPFQEVITLAEVREILLNWDDLRKTVRFVEMGRILDVQEAGKWVSGWKAQMAEIDLAAPKRQWREQDVILATAYDLKDDYLLWSSLEPREIRACVREAALLKLMAAGPADMLQMTLDEGCPTLRGLALVPEQFVDLFNQALDVSADDRPVTVSLLRGALFGVCQGLREPLAVAITRLFPPEPLTAPAVLIVDIDLDL